MKSFYLLVNLKNSDPIAASAFNCLKNDMNYGEQLKSLKRSILRQITLKSGCRQSGEEIAPLLAENTKLFVNPNKHTWTAVFDEDTLFKITETQKHIFNVIVLVRDLEDNSGMNSLALLHNLYGFRQSVETLESGVLWTLSIQAETASDARRIAEEIAVTRSQNTGLLANPHCQTVRLGTQ